MKLKQLSAAIIATSAIASGAYAGDVTVYGKAHVSLNQIEEETVGTTTQDNWELQSNASRIGVKGSLDISDSLKAIYKFEYEVIVDEDKQGDGGSNFKQRNTYGGLQGNFGTVIFGRHDTPTKLAQGKVDRFNDREAGDIKYVMVGERRENNILIYSTPKLADAIAINLAVMPGEDDGVSPGADDDGIADYFSASVTYDSDMLYLALASDSDVAGTDVVRLVGEFKSDAFKIGAIYQMAEEADTGDGVGGLSGWGAEYDAVATIEEQDAYLINGEFTIDKVVLKAQYGYSESTHTGVSSDTEITQTAIGADYKLSKQAKVYAYYSMITAENSAVGDDSETSTFGIGTEIKF